MNRSILFILMFIFNGLLSISACDDCPVRTEMVPDSNHIGIQFNNISKQGYPSLNHNGQYSLSPQYYSNLKTSHHPADFISITPSEEDASITQSIHLFGTYYINSTFSFSLIVPYHSTLTKYQQVLTLSGPVEDTIFTSQGIGDISLYVNHRNQWKKNHTQHTLYKSIGIKIPTGAHEVIDDGITQTPPVIRGVGTNSWDLLVRLHYSMKWKVPFEWKTSLHFKASTASDLRYRFGNQLFVNSSISYPFLFKSHIFSLLVGLTNLEEKSNFFEGTEVSNTAGGTLFLTTGVTWKYKKLKTHLNLNLPIRYHLAQELLGTRGALTLSSIYYF